ncbi:MAG: zeta toxin family protein [Devosia sp.]
MTTGSLDAFAGHIVILSGSPGSGKTTIAEALAHLPGAVPKVHVHTDDFWGYIKHGLSAPWLPESDAQNRMVMEIAAGVAKRYAAAGYLVFLDGVIRPQSLAPYSALRGPLHYIVLRTTVADAVARCIARGGDSLADPAIVARLHGEFGELGAFEPNPVATTGTTREQSIEFVVAALHRGSHRLAHSGEGTA